ncbi:metallophosphoesterase [Pseudonocardia sp. MH-G8]|uniref:metallophosphoesterase family protein n=1 Tax=Pseudonocardia sp. MH-G8 TaxID=1854588 RepID=UPI0018E9BBFE|nr:metallophosphoesterase [Pseudonocardia sp. MH-G8]
MTCPGVQESHIPEPAGQECGFPEPPGPPGPPGPPAPAPSRTSTGGAGWGCRERGIGAGLAPAGSRFSWLRLAPLIASRNDVLVRWFGDPTDAQRREWLRRLDGYAAAAGVAPPRRDRLVTRHAGPERVSVAVLGDPGEGDASQYVVVPVLERVANDTDFAVLCSDVVYPAGGVRAYADRFYRPYADYPRPIYALPGNHDWYDGLSGFMTAFCDAPPDAGAPSPAATGPWWRRLLRTLLWRRAPRAGVEDVADMRWYRDAESQQGGQPGPYCAIDAGPVRLVLIDTGLDGHIDRDQAAWLREVSAGDRPKILLTGRPIYTYANRQESPIEGGGDVDEIVTDPACNYVACIGGDDHNYQRYPVRQRDGRTIQYLVAGGSGAYLSATHQIPNVDRLAPAVHEEDFRCYPLRGDSLAYFSRRYDKLLGLGRGGLVISPDDATTLMAERVAITPPRPGSSTVDARTRRAAERVFPLPARGSAPAHNMMSLLFDSNAVPQFKSFLRLDAGPDEIVLSCWAATGCREHEIDPVLEDRVRALRTQDGGWEWHSETPGRATP